MWSLTFSRDVCFLTPSATVIFLFYNWTLPCVPYNCRHVPSQNTVLVTSSSVWAYLLLITSSSHPLLIKKIPQPHAACCDWLPKTPSSWRQLIRGSIPLSWRQPGEGEGYRLLPWRQPTEGGIPLSWRHRPVMLCVVVVVVVVIRLLIGFSSSRLLLSVVIRLLIGWKKVAAMLDDHTPKIRLSDWSRARHVIISCSMIGNGPYERPIVVRTAL